MGIEAGKMFGLSYSTLPSLSLLMRWKLRNVIFETSEFTEIEDAANSQIRQLVDIEKPHAPDNEDISVMCLKSIELANKYANASRELYQIEQSECGQGECSNDWTTLQMSAFLIPYWGWHVSIFNKKGNKTGKFNTAIYHVIRESLRVSASKFACLWHVITDLMS